MELCYLFLLLSLLQLATSAQEQPCPLIMATGASEEDKTGCYVISVNGATDTNAFQGLMRKVVSMSDDQRLYSSGQGIAKFLTVRVSDYSLEAIRYLPEVDFIEEETRAHGDQIPYHLDRLDQISRQLNSRYDPLNNGEGVDIYILDSGIRYDHQQFEYRAKYSGYDPIDNLDQTNQGGADCHGHGTHVASLAGGRTFGSAIGAQLYSVRVLDCTNAGPWSVILDGLNHVTQVIAQRGRPAVVSMSLSGGFFRSVNDAIQRVYNNGITIVAAAGNAFDDACSRTPASSPYVITVGGSAINDGIYGFTNFGQCVDIFAPGANIDGADHRCPTCIKRISGTSMSTPLVSGAVAIMLSGQPRLTPAEIRSKLIATATNSALDFRSIPLNMRTITPNRLLHTPGQCGGTYSAVSRGAIRSPINLPSTSYPPNMHCRWTLVASTGRVVQLDFISFFVESLYDKVQVCEGFSCTVSSRIASLSGQLQNSRYLSKTEIMTIEMTSDGRNELQGFQASFLSTGTSQGTPAPPVTQVPPTTLPPSTQPPSTQPPTTQSPTTDLPVTTMMSTTPSPPDVPTSPPSTCTPSDSTQVPMLLTGLLQEASLLIQEAVANSLSSFISSRIIGLVEDAPALDCEQIAQLKITTQPSLKSGLYWVKAGNGTTIQAHCNLDTPSCACGHQTSGWMRVADMNMRDRTQNCPSGFKLFESPVRSCGRVDNAPGCSSMFLPTNGIPYRHVCGRVIGYQYSTPNAFFAHQYNPEITLEEYFVDGVSLTYGSPRKHIWTFAGARSEVDVGAHTCPCINSNHRLPSTAIPEFIGDDYFCATGSRERYKFGKFYDEDPLWDGQGCGPNNSCCDKIIGSSGYFCTDLGATTTEDVELRVCGNENTENEDTPIEIVNVFVQ